MKKSERKTENYQQITDYGKPKKAAKKTLLVGFCQWFLPLNLNWSYFLCVEICVSLNLIREAAAAVIEQ